MPEGDTLWRTARRLDAALRGDPLVLADLRWGRLTPPTMTGWITTEVLSRGKHLLHRFDSGWTLHSHLRMEGQWRIEHPGPDTDRVRRRADLRALLATDRWTAAGLRLGMLDLTATADEGTLVGHLGPDVLGSDWDAARATANLMAVDGPLVDALLDQRRLAGVGTFWASEVLFVERVHPWATPRRLGEDKVAAIVDRIHALMSRAREHAVQSSTGILRAGENAWVHGRSGRPCRACGQPVRVALTGAAPRQRTIFSCPHCQGGLAPGDDGRPQQPLGSGPTKPRRPRYR